MREIKFRGLNYETGKWVYGYYTKLVEGIRRFDSIIVDDPEEGLTRFYISNPETIGEFTGLCDKNGREIYEGDIVSRNVPRARSGVIQFARGIFGINWDYAKNQDPEWLEGTMYGSWCGKHNLRPVDDGFVSENMEVIGNIHENPELLNG